MARRLFRVLLALWAGSMWSLLWVTQTLFFAQSDRHLAGFLAARLLGIETYVGMAAAVLGAVLPGRTRFWYGYAAAGLLAANQWALKPIMEAARVRGSVVGLTFGAWHGVSAVIYVLACVCVLIVVWRDER